MKNLVFPDAIRAKSRQDMAKLYRKLRKHDPKMARLLFQREKEMFIRIMAMLGLIK